MSEPAWISEARQHIGTREVPGRRHSPIVLGFWRLLGRPYADDETPWCGGFVGYCIRKAGLAVPPVPERAKAWADWGAVTAPRVGAVGVKSRKGGGHVFFIVGQTADGRHFKALGGNQSDQVNIIDIARSDVVAIRWPLGVVAPAIPLPTMPAGRVSTKED